jgi:AcrR family transcriptional regulator
MTRHHHSPLVRGQSTKEARSNVAELDQLPSPDGRVARGQRTRRNVVDALISLLRDGDPEPTAKAIAGRAGISLRLVFHHFSDIDDLYRAAIDHQLECHWSALAPVSPSVPLDDRIRHTLRVRSVLYEKISPVRRAVVRRSATSPELGQSITRANSLLLENLAATFSDVLARRPGGSDEFLIALDTLLSWETWDRLRQSSDLSIMTVKRIVARTVEALFSWEG